MNDFISAALLLFVILNPFALSVYLVELFRDRSLSECARIVARTVAISGAVFILFVWTGETIFRQIIQVRFAAFQILGGAEVKSFPRCALLQTDRTLDPRQLASRRSRASPGTCAQHLRARLLLRERT